MCWQRCREKLNSSNIAVGKWIMGPLWKTVWQYLKVFNNRATSWPVFFLLDIYPRKPVCTKTSTQTFTVQWSKWSKQCQWSKSPSPDRWNVVYPFSDTLRLQKEWTVNICYNQETLCEVKEACHKRLHITWFHFCGASKIDKSLGTETLICG